MDPGQFSILDPQDRADFASLVSIYQSSIEPAEQKAIAELERMRASQNYLFAAFRHDERICGFAIVFIPDSRTFWLLEYMAIEASKRASGLGQELFSQVAAMLAMRCSGAPGLIEVDCPIGAHDFVVQAQKRLRFYRRAGCRALAGLTYKMPAVTEAVPPPMYLLAYGLEGRDSVSAAIVRVWLEDIYSGVYFKSRSDPRIDEMLEPTTDPIALTSDFADET